MVCANCQVSITTNRLVNQHRLTRVPRTNTLCMHTRTYNVHMHLLLVHVAYPTFSCLCDILYIPVHFMSGWRTAATVPAVLTLCCICTSQCSMTYVSKSNVMPFPGSVASFDMFVHAPFCVTQPAICILRAVHPSRFLGNAQHSL